MNVVKMEEREMLGHGILAVVVVEVTRGISAVPLSIPIPRRRTSWSWSWSVFHDVVVRGRGER